mgnify:CR=1 FL=1
MFRFKIVPLVLLPLIACPDVHAEKPVEIADIFAREMIDADLAYFERLAGPAWKTRGDAKTYKVAGCEVTATISKDAVRSLRLELSERCTFSLAGFFMGRPGELPPAHELTFGAFDEATGASGRYYADCLVDCGNAFDPTVYEHWQGPRLDDFLAVLLETVPSATHGLDASRTWAAAMARNEDQDWIFNTRFNCTNKYDGTARLAFRDIRITAITIGRNIAVPPCE